MFGLLVRGSVVGSGKAEFGGLKKEEEEKGCAAPVKGVEHVAVGSHPAQRKSSRWGPVTSVETGALWHCVC